MADEQYSNNASTSLSGANNNSAPSLSVVSAAGFPNAAQYRIVIESEILLVTGGAGTTTWTVTRGVEGTAAAAHPAGAAVTHILTAAALRNIPDYTRRDTLTTKGDLYVATGSAAPTRLPVGTDGQADSAQAAGIKWAAPTGGAPIDATYVTTSAIGTLTNEQVLGAAVIMADVVANRPAAGTAGRLFWATDERIIYRDDGAAWVKVGTLDLADMTERDYGSLQNRTHGNADHTTGVAPADVTKAAAAEGTSAAVARADHKHDVSTAAPANVTKATAAEGTATSLARSDHKHDIATAAAADLANGNAEGSATTLARSDHTHKRSVRVAKAGIDVGTRNRLNLIEGANVTITVADDAGNDEVDVTIAASGGGGSFVSIAKWGTD